MLVYREYIIRILFVYYESKSTHFSVSADIKKPRRHEVLGVRIYDYATLDLASSANFAKPSASFTAISARTFLFKSTPANFKPCINTL